MKFYGEKLAEGTAWSLGGLVLFIVALFSIGHILVPFLLMALPFLVGYLAINAIFGKRPVYLGASETEKEKSAAPPERVAARTVTAQVVRAEGDCPLGYIFQPGDAWVLNGKVEGAAHLCPQVQERLTRSAKEIARREIETTSLVNCRIDGYVLEIELGRSEEPALAAAGR